MTGIADLAVIAYEFKTDDRGSFARVFDRDIFLAHGLIADFPQHSVAINRTRGTLRGMHYQCLPFCESKVVRCVRGRVWDVVLDVRKKSSTFGSWKAFELFADDAQMLYIGAGLAHGYVTLSDNAELQYLISAPYSPTHAAGVHWRDPQVAIDWPITEVIMSDRDANLPGLALAPDPFDGLIE